MKSKTIEKILLGFDPESSNLLPALKEISAAFGFVNEEDARKISKYFSLPLSQVYETASFYDLINTQERPALVIKVCSGTNCATQDCFRILREIESHFHIRAGDKFNPKVQLETMSCLGRCGEGPAISINGKVFTDVTRSNIHEILKRWT